MTALELEFLVPLLWGLGGLLALATAVYRVWTVAQRLLPPCDRCPTDPDCAYARRYRQQQRRLEQWWERRGGGA